MARSSIHQIERHAMDQIAAIYDQRHSGACWDAYRVAMAEVVVMSVSELEHAPNILDLGCGTGVILAMLEQRLPAARLVGLDISEGMLGEARRRMLRSDLITAVAESIPFPDSSFDVVYGNSVLHHMPDLDVVAREVSRVLRPGGVFVAFEPNTDSINGSRRLDCRILRLILKPLRSALKRKNMRRTESTPAIKEQSPAHRHLQAPELAEVFSRVFPSARARMLFPVSPFYESVLYDGTTDRLVLHALRGLDTLLGPFIPGTVIQLYAQKGTTSQEKPRCA